MNNKEFGIQLEKRTKEFSVSVIKLSLTFDYSPESKVIRNQITKSGTSIGANYREANRSRSRADFLNKIKICESESNETLYWLELIKEVNFANEKDIAAIIRESKELLAIFTSIIKKIKTSGT